MKRITIKDLRPLLDSTREALKVLKDEDLSPRAKKAVADLDKKHDEYAAVCFESHVVSFDKKGKKARRRK
jgi:hypothetical protein